ncbi:hypothetical protein [Thermosynechococcus sp. FA-CM-4201]
MTEFLEPFYTNENGVQFFDVTKLQQELNTHRFSAERAKAYDECVSTGKWVFIKPPQDYGELDKYRPSNRTYYGMPLNEYKRALSR